MVATTTTTTTSPIFLKILKWKTNYLGLDFYLLDGARHQFARFLSVTSLTELSFST